MKLNLIFSRNSQHIIGIYNDLYYKISNDLQWFKKNTISEDEKEKNIVMMGMNTWLSLSQKPLQNRMNIIITNNNYKSFNHVNNDNILCFKNIQNALNHIQSIKHHKIFKNGIDIFDLCLIDRSFNLLRKI